MISSSFGATLGFKEDGAAGVRFKIASKMTAEVFPLNAACPAAISYSTAPRLNRSVRASSSSPRACSGDIYAMVPIAEPGLVSKRLSEVSSDAVAPPPTGSAIRRDADCFASPKSRIFACERVVIKILAGLMSRCTMPRACAASNASAICVPKSSNASAARGRPAIRSRSVCPSISSITRNGRPLCEPTS